MIIDVIPKTMTLTAAIEKQRAAQEKEEMGGEEDEADQEEANGSQAGSDEEEEEGEESSRPMSEDEGELSTPEGMEED